MTTRSLARILIISVLGCIEFPASAQTFSVERANQYRAARDWQGLVRYAIEWSRAEPNAVEAWGFLGQAYDLGLHQPQNAVAPFKRAIALRPTWAPPWQALGIVYIHLRQYSDAVVSIKRAIEINPNQPTYYNNLAVAYSEGGAFNSALKALDEEMPVAERANSPQVWYVLGNGYANLQVLKSAITAYNRALQLKPGFAEAWTNLGAAFELSGDTQNALHAYGRGQALGDSLAAQDAAALRARSAPRPGGSGGISPGMVEHAWYMQRLKAIAHGSQEP